MKPNGYVLWAGPSRIDGRLVVAIATGLRAGSSNRKTGAMVQTYILAFDESPIEAARTGLDAAICGDCPLRATVPGTLKGRGCYVNLGQGPTAVYAAWLRGVYPKAKAEDIPSIGAGRMVRVGTYGDPAAVPSDVWRELLSQAKGWTGYTHQPDMVPEMRPYLMASARSAADGARLRLAGWRTFRIAAQDKDASEITCLSESHGTHCEDCGLCNGAGQDGTRVNVKSIVITAHGSGARYATALEDAR